MTIFPRSPLQDEIREPEKTLTSTDHIFANIVNQDLKFLHEVLQDFFANGFFSLASEPSQKKSYSENATMTCLKQRNHRIQSSETKCYETSSQNRIKESSMPQKSATSRGQPPLHYINEKFLNDTNDTTSFRYIGVHRVTI